MGVVLVANSLAKIRVSLEDGPVVYPGRLTRLTLVCEVNRYSLVQVRQNLKSSLSWSRVWSGSTP